MSMALQIRVDDLCRQVGELTARVRELEAVAPRVVAYSDEPDADPTNAAVEGDDAPKRGPGRPRKTP